MTYCENCQTVEGAVRHDEDGEIYCADCDSEEPLQRLPEHDDFDLER